MPKTEHNDPFYVFLREFLEKTEYGQAFMQHVKDTPRDYAAEAGLKKSEEVRVAVPACSFGQRLIALSESEE